jgi:hypothetical protein
MLCDPSVKNKTQCMIENEISGIVFDAGMKIHRKLGIGLYENVYENV